MATCIFGLKTHPARSITAKRVYSNFLLKDKFVCLTVNTILFDIVVHIKMICNMEITLLNVYNI